MANRLNPPPPVRFANPREERIHRRLLLLGAGPASFYLDACRMRAERTLRTTSHLVSHCFREIEGAIREVLLPAGYSVPEGSENAKHRAEVDAILRSYGFGDDEAVSVAWRKLATGQTQLSPHRRAHRNALSAPRSIDEPTQQEFLELMEAVFDAVLERFERRFLESFPLIDTLLAKHPPSKKDVKALRNRVPHNPVTLERFFSRVSDPAWLELLAQGGYFLHPPEPIIDDETQTTRLAPWPESRYLIRMAHVPELQGRVAEVALAVPLTTNSYVIQDLVEIALALPVHLGIRFAEKADEWLNTPYVSLVPERLGKLAEKLADAGETEPALAIAASLLSLSPTEPFVEGSVARPRRSEPTARFEHWSYSDILTNSIPVLIDATGLPAFRTLCEALRSAVELSQSHRGQQPRDYSYAWRTAIEEHEQNRGRADDLLHMLVDSVRDAAERVAQAGPEAVQVVIETLAQYGWNVFRRIELHVLRVAPQVPRNLIAGRLVDRSLFGENDVWHEYSLLANAKWSELLPDEQATVLSWIEQGPDLTLLPAKGEGQLRSPEELAEHTRDWQVRQLARIEEVLPPNWRERYHHLISELGRPQHPDLLTYHGTWWGPTSPLAAEDLSRMSTGEIVAYLRNWQPERGFAASSPEGLSRALTTAVAANPGKFSEETRVFRGLEPTYVRGILSGFREAVKKERSFPWGPILDLCQWVVEQGQEDAALASKRAGDSDPGWGWSRKETANLLEAGLVEGLLELSIDHREQVWAILRLLTEDPEPTPAYEAQYGSTHMGPFELSINTTRGVAMHAAVYYGLWVRRHRRSEPDQDAARHDLDVMPELREVLDQHLDMAIDPSTTIRSTYGYWLPSLFSLDEQWVRAQRPRIFSPEEELFQAAWSGYIRYNRPHEVLLSLLTEEYTRAVELLGSALESRRSLDEEQRLAEHLMVFYIRSELALDAPLLTRFFAHAPASIRAHAIDFLGRIAHDERDLGEQMLTRMRALWESRQTFTLANPIEHTEELQVFGWWFVSGQFPPEWTFEKLIQVLQSAGRVEPDHLVLQRLAERSEAMPLQCVDCVRLLIEGAQERWRILTWRSEIRQILQKVLASENEEARVRARETINVLAAKGWVEFADLLQEVEGPDPESNSGNTPRS